MQTMMYFDHAAATPMDPTVQKAMQPFFEEEYGNPSALHSAGQRTRVALENARLDVATCLNARAREIVFTSCGTESNNMALFGVVAASGIARPHVIVSAIEHSSVLSPVQELRRRGVAVTIVPVDSEGTVDVKAIQNAITKRTVLVSVMYANNEIGTIAPLRAIAKIIRGARTQFGHQYPYFHSDACQASTSCDMDTAQLHVDLMTLNASKMYGPKGVGVLYIRAGTLIHPLLWGGDQEFGMRPGTENVAGVVGMATALQLARKSVKKETSRLEKLRETLIKGILTTIPKAVLNGSRDNRLANNVHISFPGYDGEAIVLYLNARGIQASTGAACTAQAGKESHVLKACGFDRERIRGGVRFSLGRGTTLAQIRTVIAVIPAVLEKL